MGGRGAAHVAAIGGRSPSEKRRERGGEEEANADAADRGMRRIGGSCGGGSRTGWRMQSELVGSSRWLSGRFAFTPGNSSQAYAFNRCSCTLFSAAKVASSDLHSNNLMPGRHRFRNANYKSVFPILPVYPRLHSRKSVSCRRRGGHVPLSTRAIRAEDTVE